MRLRAPFRRLVRSPGPAAPGAATAPRAPAVETTLVVAALALLNVVKHRRTSGGVPTSAAAALALLAYAQRSGLSWEDLGLARHQLRSGRKWAAVVVVVVGSAYLAALQHPRTRAPFLDTRYEMRAPEALKATLVGIPLGTVLLEEVAFRSVLWGMLERHTTTTGALLASSSLFGLWHILPSLDFASANQGLDPLLPGTGASRNALVALGTVAFTGLGGVVAGELRRRSGSVLASAGMHWATNALGIACGLAARRLERDGSARPVPAVTA